LPLALAFAVKIIDLPLFVPEQLTRCQLAQPDPKIEAQYCQISLLFFFNFKAPARLGPGLAWLERPVRRSAVEVQCASALFHGRTDRKPLESAPRAAALAQRSAHAALQRKGSPDSESDSGAGYAGRDQLRDVQDDRRPGTALFAARTIVRRMTKVRSLRWSRIWYRLSLRMLFAASAEA
jgi:hypothetical protein